MIALWQLGRYRVAAMLTTLPSNSFKPYCVNTNLYLSIFMDMRIALNPMQQTITAHVMPRKF